MPVSKKPRKPRAGAGTGSRKKASDIPALPDRRAMEGALSRFTAGFGSGPVDDALAQAQDLMYTAWETPDRRRRISLAEQALRISPLCADAYVLLAEETAATPEEAIELYRKGMEAGERAVGPAAFRDDVGHFWGLLETRPYMRAAADWRRRCGWPDTGTKRSAITGNSCASTRTTTRVTATFLPPACSTSIVMRTSRPC